MCTYCWLFLCAGFTLQEVMAVWCKAHWTQLCVITCGCLNLHSAWRSWLENSIRCHGGWQTWINGCTLDYLCIENFHPFLRTNDLHENTTKGILSAVYCDLAGVSAGLFWNGIVFCLRQEGECMFQTINLWEANKLCLLQGKFGVAKRALVCTLFFAAITWLPNFSSWKINYPRFYFWGIV